MDEAISAAIDALNRMLKADPDSMGLLLNFRVGCNAALDDDPTCQTRDSGYGTSTVSMLGVINGLFGVGPNSSGFITLIKDWETGHPIRANHFQGRGWLVSKITAFLDFLVAFFKANQRAASAESQLAYVTKERDEAVASASQRVADLITMQKQLDAANHRIAELLAQVAKYEPPAERAKEAIS